MDKYNIMFLKIFLLSDSSAWFLIYKRQWIAVKVDSPLVTPKTLEGPILLAHNEESSSGNEVNYQAASMTQCWDQDQPQTSYLRLH